MFTISALITGLMLAALGYQVIQMWSMRKSLEQIPRRPITGRDALVGAEGEVIEPFYRNEPAAPPLGRVRIGAELWSAELVGDTARLAAAGDRVRVVDVNGLVLKVECR